MRDITRTVTMCFIVASLVVGTTAAGATVDEQPKPKYRAFCDKVEAAFEVDDALPASKFYKARAKKIKKLATIAPTAATRKAAAFLVEYFKAKARDDDTPSGFLKAITAFNKICGPIKL